MIPLTSTLLNTTFNVQQFLGLFIAIIILLILSAFFSMSETAYSTINVLRLRKLADENVKGARRTLQIVDNYEKTLSTILVGNNLVNITNTTLCAYMFGVLIVDPTLSNLLNTVIMTLIILIFGEILPKSLAKYNSEKLAILFSGPFVIISKLLYPITLIFYGLQKSVLKKSKSNGSNPTVTKDDLENIIDTMEEEGVIKSEEADLYMGVIEINEKTVYDIMTPRVDVVAVDINEKTNNVTKAFIDHGYSRLPVYENDKDHVVGVLSYKDYFQALIKGEEVNIKKIMIPATYVAENMTVKELIKTMQVEKKHLAIVLDENGGTSGIVTMEDALEEVVGEIYDEHDDKENLVLFNKIDENKYEVDAKMELADLFEELEIEHLPDTEYSTVGGYLYELSANLPYIDQVLEVFVMDEQPNDEGEYVVKNVKLSFRITKMEERRIKKVLLTTETLSDANEKFVQEESV